MRHIYSKIALVLVFFVSVGITSESHAQKHTSSTETGDFYLVEKDYPGTMDGYNLYVPKSNPREAKPVIVFLQGGKGVGGDVEKILNWGLPKLLVDGGTDNSELNKLLLETFIVIMPHIARGEFYENEVTMRKILSEVKNNHSVDSNRIYLTGLSRGGYGSWGLASRMSDVFVAVAPICGGGYGIKSYEALTNLPLWISHNRGDKVVPYRASQRIVDRLKEMGTVFHETSSLREVSYKNNDKIFTSVRSNSHDAWTDFYTSPDVYRWLLKYRKE